VAEGATEGGKRDTRIAARRFDDAIARMDSAAAVGVLQHEERHPILDAACQTERLVLGVDSPRLTAIEHVDCEERCVADELVERFELRSGGWRDHGGTGHHRWSSATNGGGRV
jgi:hypothetical protein